MSVLPVSQTVADLRARIAVERNKGRTIGLVPTMGGLHEGHLSLFRAAREKADTVVATLFVNPKQFDKADGFSAYPRTLEKDSEMMAECGVDLLYAPAISEIYPDGFLTKVSVAVLTDCLCGIHRPGHMDGVATVVTKLLIQSMPDIALFGEKDYQQLLMIKRLSKDLDLPIAIEGRPTIREDDGLAMSSRNFYLSPAERQIAPVLHQVLSGIAERAASGQTIETALEEGKGRLLESGFSSVDYLEMRSADDLSLMRTADRPARIFGAAFLGKARLIDNVAVN